MFLTYLRVKARQMRSLGIGKPKTRLRSGRNFIWRQIVEQLLPSFTVVVFLLLQSPDGSHCLKSACQSTHTHTHTNMHLLALGSFFVPSLQSCSQKHQLITLPPSQAAAFGQGSLEQNWGELKSIHTQGKSPTSLIHVVQLQQRHSSRFLVSLGKEWLTESGKKLDLWIFKIYLLLLYHCQACEFKSRRQFPKLVKWAQSLLSCRRW